VSFSFFFFSPTGVGARSPYWKTTIARHFHSLYRRPVPLLDDFLAFYFNFLTFVSSSIRSTLSIEKELSPALRPSQLFFAAEIEQFSTAFKVPLFALVFSACDVFRSPPFSLVPFRWLEDFLTNLQPNFMALSLNHVCSVEIRIPSGGPLLPFLASLFVNQALARFVFTFARWE